jgi:hypothetical protein
MFRHAKRVAIQVAGWIFVLLGIIGLFLPVLQGILFLMIGLYLLSHEYAWAERWRQKLRDRYPEVFRRARFWQVRLGLSRTSEPGDPEPLSPARRIAVWVTLAALLVAISFVGRAGVRSASQYWGDLQQRYQVVEVRQQDNAQVVKLRRNWVLRDRDYLVKCHICEPIEVGSSYRFETVPGENPPMMKRVLGPGEVPDFYTVVEGVPPLPPR